MLLQSISNCGSLWLHGFPFFFRVLPPHSQPDCPLTTALTLLLTFCNQFKSLVDVHQTVQGQIQSFPQLQVDCVGYMNQHFRENEPIASLLFCNMLEKESQTLSLKRSASVEDTYVTLQDVDVFKVQSETVEQEPPVRRADIDDYDQLIIFVKFIVNCFSLQRCMSSEWRCWRTDLCNLRLFATVLRLPPKLTQ